MNKCVSYKPSHPENIVPQWLISQTFTPRKYSSAVVDPGFPRRDEPTYYLAFLSKNCIKIKEIKTRGGVGQ